MSVFFDSGNLALAGVQTDFNPTSSFSFSCERKRRRAVDGTEEKENAVGAYRQSAILTVYCAFGSAVAQRFDLLLFPLPLAQGFPILPQQRQRKEKNTKSTSTLHSRKYRS